MTHYLSIATELFTGLILLFIVTKALGKTQFSQITPFDFISAMILGEMVGNAIYDHEVKVLEIVFATLFWGLLIFLVEIITQKFKGTRKFLEGEPNIVIRKGVIKYKTLKKCRLDINQLQSLIRQQGFFSIQEIEYAILETNGMVSVMPKSKFDIPKKVDFDFPEKKADLPVTLIIDGEVVYDNLREAGLNEEWLLKQLHKKGIKRYEEVLFAEWKKNQPLYMIRHERETS